MIVRFIWSHVEVFVTSGEEHEWTLWAQKASKTTHNLLCFSVRRVLGFHQILLWVKEIRVLAAEAGGGLSVTVEVLFTQEPGFHTHENKSCKLSLVTITQENPSMHPPARKCLHREALGSSDSLKKWQIHVSWLMLTPEHPLVKCVYFLVEGTWSRASEQTGYDGYLSPVAVALRAVGMGGGL